MPQVTVASRPPIETAPLPTAPAREAKSWAVLLAPAILGGAFVARAWLLAHNPEFDHSPWTVAGLSLQCDAPLFGIFCAALWLGAKWLPPRLQAWLRALAVAFVLVIISDVVTLGCFGTRLSWGRIVTFAPMPDVIGKFLLERFGWTLVLLSIAAAAGFAFAAWRLPWRLSRSASVPLAIGAALGVLGWLQPIDPDHLPRWLRENVVSLNTPNPQKKRYSPAAAEKLLAQFAAVPRRTLQAPGERRNVILIVIESWSSFHSRAFGGPLDWTPELDRLATENTRFTRFHAGGYCTAEGLVGLLGGVRLWVPYGSLSQLDQLPQEWTDRDTLPKLFDRAGYATAFLTTGALDFVGKDTWLKRIGFAHVEGNNHPFYAAWPRWGVFDAAHDEALYRRALQWIGTRADDRPFLLTLETVTSHTPYRDPESGRLDAEGSFRYADRWAAWFVAELKKKNYFDHGIVVITSDHRAMMPVGPGEKSAFGLGLLSRVPLVVIDPRRQPGEVNDAVFKQADLTPSFQHWLGQTTELDSYSASLFETDAPTRNVALHRRERDAATVDVITDRGEGQVKLAGDGTAFLWSREIPSEQRADILALIARERLALAAPAASAKDSR